MRTLRLLVLTICLATVACALAAALFTRVAAAPGGPWPVGVPYTEGTPPGLETAAKVTLVCKVGTGTSVPPEKICHPLVKGWMMEERSLTPEDYQAMTKIMGTINDITDSFAWACRQIGIENAATWLADHMVVTNGYCDEELLDHIVAIYTAGEAMTELIVRRLNEAKESGNA